MKNRYSRQEILPEIGVGGQEKIGTASILCIGAGGLGCPALLYLAAAGIGRIGIVDFDTVDESNLQRQILFTTDQIGQNKATAAKARLNALNPQITITAHQEELSDKNALTLFENYDLIIDGSDNFATKFLINDAAVKTGKAFIYGSILGFEGQVSVFNHQGGPCYRCLFPQPPSGHVPNCAEAGVIGAVAGMIGTMQAMEAIKIIVGDKSFTPLTGKLVCLDMRTMDNKTLTLPKNPDCPVCSKSPQDIALKYTSPTCGVIPQITAQDMRAHKTALLIDVRETAEWEAGHIGGAQHFALSRLTSGACPDIPKNHEIILYCQKGIRSKQAAQILQDKGYETLSSLHGGYDAWLNL
ncbi:MAG: molybdopterin-synthase adenylyltransferase MoeB [Alphaproteobacteria bacterium]